MSIIEKIKQAQLVGRGGAAFPVADKWMMVSASAGKKKYVVCNCSEGEPGVKKDGYIIEKHADRVIDGMALAITFLKAEKGIFYLNGTYFKKYKDRLDGAIKKSGAPIELFAKPHIAGYIGGDETCALNVIEGKRAEPRLKPPYPPVSGLWGMPTLINNVETFYDVSLVAAGEYEGKRLYTITGDCVYEGVFELSQNLTIEQVLRNSHNYPKFSFFVQVGGDGSGEVLSQRQLGRVAGGAGSIRILSLTKHRPRDLILEWVDFFNSESCGQCTPCREGTYRLKESMLMVKTDWALVSELLENLADTALCGLGTAVPIPIRSYVKNVLPTVDDHELGLPLGTLDNIITSFK